MKRNIIILNIFFITLFVIFLILSLFFWFFLLIPFFFLPIICYLPFAFKGKKRRLEPLLDIDSQIPKIRKCPACGGEIREPIAQYCYHCGSELNKE